MPYRRKGRFNGIGCPYVDPVFGRAVVEGEEHVLVLGEALAGFGELRAVQRKKGVIRNECLLLRRCQVHVVDLLLGLRLDA